MVVPSLASLARAQCSQASQNVAGNIHRPEFRAFWESLNPDSYVMSIIRNGYKIPFRDGIVPQAYRERNNRSALDNMPYLQEHVEGLVLNTTVSEVFTQPLCCNPLTVASRYVNGLLKLRMCIDLSRYINLLLKKEAVVLPGLEKALKLLLPGDFQATFDLKSAFHHVLIHPDHRKYLGFSIPGPTGQDRFFVFRVLPLDWPLQFSSLLVSPSPYASFLLLKVYAFQFTLMMAGYWLYFVNWQLNTFVAPSKFWPWQDSSSLLTSPTHLPTSLKSSNTWVSSSTQCL